MLLPLNNWTEKRISDESGAEESGSEEESPGVLADDWRPSRSYEDHMKKLMKDFQQHNNSDADG